MALCSDCGAPLSGATCFSNRCLSRGEAFNHSPTKPVVNKQKSVQNKGYPEIGEPGDYKDVIFKRYTISERKSFKQYAGFDLYALKAKGDKQSWEIVKEFNEVEGKNSFLKLLFGRSEQGNVFYVNTSEMLISFDWLLLVNSKQYQVTINLSVQVETPEYFLNQYQGHQQLALDTIKSLLENPIQRSLVTELEQLSQSSSTSVNFTQFDSLLNRIAAKTVEPRCLQITSLTMSGQALPDIEQELLAQKIKRLNNDEAIKKHQSTVSSNIAIYQINDHTREILADINAQKVIAGAQADKEANDQSIQTKSKLQKDNDNTEVGLQQSKNKAKVVSAQGEVNQAENKNEIVGAVHEVEIANIKAGGRVATDKITATGKSEIDQIVADTNRGIQDKDMTALIDMDTYYETSKIKLEQLKNGSLQLQSEKNDHIKNDEGNNGEIQPDNVDNEDDVDEMPAHTLIRCERVINIVEQDQQVSNMHDFGQYFWNLVMSYSPEVNDLLTNARLHYIRYEDNYCNDLPSIMNLYQIFKGIKSFDCYRSYTEAHIVLGKNIKVQQEKSLNCLESSGRMRLLTLLLNNYKTHSSVSLKGKIHDRDMCLVFTNGAHIRLKFTYGMAFWGLDTKLLPKIVTTKLQKNLEYKDIDKEFSETLKKLEMPVYCKKTEKDTTIPLWGWLPQ